MGERLDNLESIGIGQTHQNRSDDENEELNPPLVPARDPVHGVIEPGLNALL
jgi:hypothetical protein